jgi:acetyltransferase-like isoleucine patch superfamily enzyme
VTRPVASRAIVGGNPARVLGERGAAAIGSLTVEIQPVPATPVA